MGRLYHTGASHWVSLLPPPVPPLSRSCVAPGEGATTQNTIKRQKQKTARDSTEGCGGLAPPRGAKGPTPEAPCDGSTALGMRDFILEWKGVCMGKRRTVRACGVEPNLVFLAFLSKKQTKSLSSQRSSTPRPPVAAQTRVARHAPRVRRARGDRVDEWRSWRHDGGHRLRRPRRGG